MAISCTRFGQRDVLGVGLCDYWFDAGGNIFRSPEQGEWPPGWLDSHGFPASWEFVAWGWELREWVLAFWEEDAFFEGNGHDAAADELWKGATSGLAPRASGKLPNGNVACRTRVSDRAGGQIYIQSPLTGMEIVIPFTRYEDLGDLHEKIVGDFAEQTRGSRERKPWALVEYAPEDLKLARACASETRKARY